jgi:poly-gamma-glutamate capsule biosynthesis protein CapA/YwtB (metallophosphatase superfamily)
LICIKSDHADPAHHVRRALDTRTAMTLASGQPAAHSVVRLFVCGDAMLGRGIDQIMAHACNPCLYESYVNSALDYVRLAEDAHGPIPRHVDPSYVWGEALDELDRMQPDARLVNLETSVTRSEGCEPKGINYRMSPEDAEALLAAAIDCCVLANNHVLDWGRAGLFETLATLQRLHIKTAGAGHTLAEASAPAVLEVVGKGRVLVFSFASVTSGTPNDWAATPSRAGVNVLPDLLETTAVRVADQIAAARQPGDVVVVSIHWGGNWGYQVPADQRQFAHRLIERADVSVIHGHSSHHPKAIEVYRNRLILYGCGDVLNDYEGIKGYEAYRDDLSLMYFADVDRASRDLVALEIVPLHIRRFRLAPPSAPDVAWVRRMLEHECGRFGAGIVPTPSGSLSLAWSKSRTSPTVAIDAGLARPAS